MFVTLINRIDQKQTTAAENKLFALKKYVTRNNSPELPVDGNIIGQISISRIVILKKNEKQILVICVIEQHRDNNDRSGKKSPNLFSPDHAYA